MDATTNIIELKGIGEKSATAFGRLGIRDVDSLITMNPKYYLTYDCIIYTSQRKRDRQK